MEKKKYRLIGACSCWGAQIRACERGPEDLLHGNMVERLQDRKIFIEEVEMVYPEKRAKYEDVPLKDALPMIHDFNVHLAESVKRALENGAFPVVVGGDHVNAVGTWNGVASGLKSSLGLLWIDAHMDAHTMETTPSGAYHGMPVAALLGYGVSSLAHLILKEALLKPRQLVLVGVRSFEEGEAALLKKLKVKIYFIEEVKRRGLKEVLLEAISYISQNTSHYGVSLDLDVFDPKDVPGVGSPEPNGLSVEDLLPLLSIFRKDPKFAAFEMVEFNPQRDIDHKTRESAFEILSEIMKST